MNLHEYQGKEILAQHGVNVQRGVVLDDLNEIENVSKKLVEETGTDWFVVKAQIHAGGRGKGGGVKIAKSKDDLKDVVSSILGMNLITPQTSKEGKLVRKVLIAEDVYYPGTNEPKEYYLGILLEFGVAAVKGIEKNNVMACPKHFALNSIENSNNKER